MQPKYKRILLKLSGEVLKGQSTACHDEATLAAVAERYALLHLDGTPKSYAFLKSVL